MLSVLTFHQNVFVFLLAALCLSCWLGLQQQQVEKSRLLASVRSLQDSQQLQPPELQLNDRTITLSPTMERPWLTNSDSLPKPNRKLILTDFGWNHKNQTFALAHFSRSLRSRELLQAFVDHPQFDPTFRWSDMVEGKVAVDTSIEYVVLMDIETCFESNYPNYVGTYPANADAQGGRVVNEKADNPCYQLHECRDIVQSVLDAPLFHQVNASTLMYLECGGNGPNWAYRSTRQMSTQLSIISLSSSSKQLNSRSDMGMPPPPLNPLTLSSNQQQAIQSCQAETNTSRPYLFTFVGDGRIASPRGMLFKLNKHSGDDVQLLHSSVTTGGLDMYEEPQSTTTKNESLYTKFMRTSLFAATPRGSNRYSYRFTEALSGGAIPVVHSDGWILAFRPELIDWTQCAVVLPEAKLNETIGILRNITPEKRCQMRNYCYFEIYQKYMVNAQANMQGFLDSLEALPTNKKAME